MYITSLNALYDPIRYIAAGAITEAWVGIGTEFGNMVRMLRIVNVTDADLFLTFNVARPGSLLDQTEIFLPAYSTNTDDITANAFNTDNAGILVKAKGSRLYVRWQAPEQPTVKGVYVMAMHGGE